MRVTEACSCVCQLNASSLIGLMSAEGPCCEEWIPAGGGRVRGLAWMLPSFVKVVGMWVAAVILMS